MATTKFLRQLSTAAACMFLVASCATGPKVVKVYEDAGYQGQQFKNILVVGVARNYDRRAEFEQMLASRLSPDVANARAYYTIVSGSQPVENDDVMEAVRTHGFDAIVVTRILSQDTDLAVKSGTSTATATRRSGRAIDFFRYDYGILDDPQVYEIENSAVLLTELYAAENQEKVWAIQSIVADQQNIPVIISEVTEAIARQMVRDGLTSR